MSSDFIKLNLGRKAVGELFSLVRFSNDLQRIIVAAGEVGPKVGVRAVAHEVANKIGMKFEEVRALLVAMLNFFHTKTNLKLELEATADVITWNLRQAAKTRGRKKRVIEWEEAKERIVDAVRLLHPDHPLLGAHKALRVAVSRQYELVGMRVFTDIRPVFNEAGEVIVQTIVTHVLSLDYHDGHDHHVIQFNLDAGDVSELKELCERAIKKGVVVKRDFQRMPWPTSVFREKNEPDLS